MKKGIITPLLLILSLTIIPSGCGPTEKQRKEIYQLGWDAGYSEGWIAGKKAGYEEGMNQKLRDIVFSPVETSLPWAIGITIGHFLLTIVFSIFGIKILDNAREEVLSWIDTIRYKDTV